MNLFIKSVVTAHINCPNRAPFSLVKFRKGEFWTMAVRLDEREPSNLDKQTLVKMYLGLQDSVEKLSQSIDILTEEVINLHQHRFVRSSEKGLTEVEGYFQLGFMFNETEMTVDLYPDIPEPTF